MKSLNQIHGNRIPYLFLLSIYFLFSVVVYSGCASNEPTKNTSAGNKSTPDPTPEESPQPRTDAAASPTPAGFDIDSVPIVDSIPGTFPYFTLIEGYKPMENGPNKDAAFDRYEFFDGNKIIPIEGRLKTFAADGEGASAFEVFKTYEAMVKNMGGVRVFEGKIKDMEEANLEFDELRHRHPGFGDDKIGVYMVRAADKEIWVETYVSKFPVKDNYFLTVVEKKALDARAKLVTADEMKKAIDADGHIALYINFDFGKADIKPESRPVIDEIVKLMKENPGLNLTVEGHTDSVGKPDSNKRLSNARAKSVVSALTSDGIDARRLNPVGHGQEKPIADNSTDEGRAKNRRVELVKIS